MMDWTTQVFRYCERGLEAGFWGEPVNAVTNAGFVMVGVIMLVRLRNAGMARGGSGALAWLLSATVMSIGIGSFLFHTLATRWAQLADTVPIAVFMLTYLGFALRYFLGWGVGAIAGGVVAFMLALWMAPGIECALWSAALSGQGDGHCLNGTLGYAPALVALACVGGWLGAIGHSAAPPLLWAAVVLLMSMVLRAVDIQACAGTAIAGYRLGTHFLWHILNAAVLYLLMQPVLGMAEQRGAKR